MKRETNRSRLETVIPLQTPFVLHIEPTNACNLKCRFCCNHDDALFEKLGIKRGFMEKRVFEKLIDDCKKFPNKIKRVLFHHRGEPLLHKELLDFIRCAKDAQIAETMVMFTNGVLLTKELAEKLGNCGLDVIQISVEGVSAEKYEEVTGRRIDYDKFLENIAYLYHKKSPDTVLHAKIVNCGLSDAEKEKFYREFSPISDDCYIETLMDMCPSDVMDTTLGFGKTTTQEGLELRERLVCTQPFYVAVVEYDGAVMGCSCGDWRNAMRIGSILEEDLCDIWNGKKHRELCQVQLRGERKRLLACSDCKGILNQLDDIDAYRADLLKKFE